MQTDILNQLQNGQWKRDGSLIIPAYLNKYLLSPLDVSAAVYLTHEEVLGKKYTRAELQNDLGQLSVEDCIATTSKMLTVLSNEGQLNKDAQRGIAQELYGGEIKEKILGVLNREPGRVVFFELQLLLLAKYAMLFAKNEPANDFMEMKLFPTFMQIVLGITDLLAEETEGSNEPELQKAAIRSMYFFSRLDIVQSLGRVEDLFVTIPNELRTHHQYLDIPALFQEATGLTLEKYLFLGFSLIVLPMGQNPGAYTEDNWHIKPEHYFSQALVSKDEIELIMREFATDVQTLEALYRNQDNFEYNFDGLVQHPLVTFDKQRFFPLSLGLLKDKITLQIYWILFDYIKKKSGDNKLRRYTSFMGACFEEYVFKLLTRIYPLSSDRLVREITYSSGKSEVKTADNIVINLSSLILIETKVSQLQVYRTGIVGDLEAFRKDIRKIVVEAFTTIQRTKEAFQRGILRKEISVEPARITNFYPVVVTYGTFILFPLVWKIVEEEIKIIPNYDPELLDRLQIIQADEIEMIEAFLEKSGMTFEALLQKKIADPVYKHLSFHTIFYNEFHHLGPLKSKYANQKFDDFIEELGLKILGQKIDVQESKNRRANNA
jgi:hypothetical protein